MKGRLIAETAVNINAPAEKVWKALITPALISKYLFGTKVTADWKVGGQIAYEGEYSGTKYHDKGIIKKLEPNKVFASTYWSSMGGKEDKPENYNLVTYTLTEKNGKTNVMLIQDNILTEDEKELVIKNWKGVLDNLKKVVEEL